MCHGITWYHALCLHPSPTPLFHIACKNAFRTGEHCFGFESLCLPMVGACDACNQRGCPEESEYCLLAWPEHVTDEEEYEMVDSDDDDEDEDEEFRRVTF